MVVGVESALDFIGKVKEVYAADPSRYQEFIDAMRNFKGGRINAREVTKRVLVLFQGHPELIEGYATFLPPGNTIQVPVDSQGNILVTMPTGTMEIARDGTVINETHTQALGPQGAETELAERDKRLLENIQARIADSEEYKAKYEMFKAPFEAYLRTPPEQRKVLFGADQGHEFGEKLKELLGDDDGFKQVLSEAFN